MLRKLRPTVRVLGLVLLAACGGGDSPTAGNPPPAPKLASLTITIADVPDGATANVTVTGPNGFSRTIANTTTIADLTAGGYVVTATDAETGNAIYAAIPPAQNVELAAGSARALDVTYALASGILELTVTGLPAQRDAAITLSGPNNFTRQVTKNETFVKLTPGAYVINAVAVTADGDGYAAGGMPRTIDLTTSLAPFAVTVPYAITTGRLQVHANGLPQGASAAFQVTGPGGFNQSAAPGQVLVGLAPGIYTISATNVVLGSSTYVPGPVSVSVSVVPSPVAAQANVAYTLQSTGGGGTGGQLNLTIDRLYITQAVQTSLGDVPLVAGRDGLVRVFVKANTSNTAQPQVRVRLYQGSTLVHTLNLNAPAASVPTTIEDVSLLSAWHGLIAGAHIQPGLRLVADVDPANTVAEGSEADNSWPASGTAAMTVRTVPTLMVRFVPVRQSNDVTGNVSAANTAAFLNDIRRMYPIGSIDADVRPTYTTSAPVLQANDNNNAWQTVLSEVHALRALDGSNRYYYGVVKTGYSSGVAGMGYLGAPAAIGWDYLPSGSDVMAHELGHNWRRFHAPCGGAGSPDPAYPYAGGKIGVTGYDLTTALFKTPAVADVMGYCSSPWVSDYTYKGIMNYRETHALVATASATRAPEPGLLVWGRITAGEVVLEPAFDVVARPSLPQRAGPHRIEALADDGSTLFSYAFDGEVVDHGSPENRHFAFVVPQSVLRGRSVATLRLRGHGRTMEHRSAVSARAAMLASDAAPSVRRTRGRTAQVSWSESSIRGVLVRDARTGDVLTFARSRVAQFDSDTPDVELIVSDGVRSHVRRAAVR